MSKAPAVDYALQIIEYFAAQRSELGIADISNALDINKNAVSRVLEALVEKNWICASDSANKKYKLTLRPFTLISKSARDSDLARVASPQLAKLNEKFGDAVYLGVKNGRNVLYLMHFDSTKEVRINGSVGGEYPLNCSAPGKILLACSEAEEVKSFFDVSADRRTEKTLADFESFSREAEKIKKAGYAVDDEEFAKGIICIAVPVFDSTGKTVASIGMSTLTLYEDVESLIKNKFPLLREAANEISQCLGAEKQI